VRAALAAAGDPDRARQQQAYMKSALAYHGVGLPAVRRLVGDLVAEHPLADRPAWESTVLELWDDATHREERYAALALLRHRRHRGWLDPELLPLVRHLVVTGAWWDTVDELAAHVLGTILATHRAAVTPVVREWSTCDDLWLRRSAILAQLRHGSDTDVGLLTDALDANLAGSPYGTEFFIRKAVGWALRQHARTDPAWVRAYVAARSDRLSTLSRREALKHLG
jgi:3-methyladenine DNA glycosylase AlkD